MLRFFILGLGIGIGIFGVFLLSLMPVVSLDVENETYVSSAQNQKSWVTFTSALGLDDSARQIPKDDLTLPHWVSVPSGAFGVRSSTTAIHAGGPGSVMLSFSTASEPEILQEYYETLFASKGLKVEDRLKPSDPSFNIVVSIFAVDHRSDRSARLIIRDQLEFRKAQLTFTTNGAAARKMRTLAAR